MQAAVEYEVSCGWERCGSVFQTFRQWKKKEGSNVAPMPPFLGSIVRLSAGPRDLVYLVNTADELEISWEEHNLRRWM